MKLFKIAAIAALSLFTLASCSENQSVFNVQDVPGRCLIEGVITYNEGTTIENGHFNYNYKPAAELEVTVIVQNSEYDDSFTGVSTFTTVTDADGKYSIEIPAALKNANVKIQTADFRGVRSFITNENNQVVTKKENVIYRGITYADVHSQGIVYANIVCTECSVDNLTEGMTQLANLKGKVGQGVEYVDPARRNYNEYGDFVGYTDARRYYVYEGAKADMIITVDYQGQTFTYNVTSDAEGEWSLQVPVYGFPASFTYNISAMPYNSKYTHYVAEERTYTLNEDDYERTYTTYIGQTLEGFYAQVYSAEYNANFPVAAQTCSNDSKIMIFEPLNNGQDTYGYNMNSFSYNDLWLSELLEKISE